MRLIASAFASCLATTAAADVIVTFRDGAPKDRFTITNTADCATGPMTLALDLAPAPAGLIFDITGDGAGVDVFQPFEVAAGGDIITAVSDVADGDQRLELALQGLEAGAEVAFTIDLDDTGGGREITVSGSEIAGAMVQVISELALAEGAFDDSGTARVILASCTS